MTEKLRVVLPWLTFWLIAFAGWAVRSYEGPALTYFLLGVIGVCMMLVTELAYSYRKQGIIRIGKVSSWLKVHIGFGIVGPLVILWHTDLQFFGFAGWLAAVTLVVVASGFLGRSLFKSMRKAADLKKQIEALRVEKVRIISELYAVAEEKGAQVFEPPILAKAVGDNERLTALGTLTIARTEKHADESPQRSIGLLLAAHDSICMSRAQLQGEFDGLHRAKQLLPKWRFIHTWATILLFAGIIIHVISVFYFGKIL